MKALDEITLNDKDRKAIKMAAKILRQKFPVEQIVLFGSKARGEDDAESDIDLLVLTRDQLSWQERYRITDTLYDLQLELEVMISTLVVTTKEWREGIYQVMPIQDEIERDGVIA